MTSPVTGSGEVVLDHGSGAQLSHELISLIVETLGDVYIGEMEDSAMLSLPASRIAMTTDSFVVDPPFFGNGDIGKIAVCGTVNDLAVVGARPLYLTLGMILETGLPIDRLVRVLTSIRETAREAGVLIVCGDTKVVRKGEADQIYLNTAGVGVFERTPLRMRDVRPGDRVVLSGPIGNHTVHLLSIREGLGFEQRVLSDCAPLNGLLDDLFTAVGEGAVHSVRDVTRGGLAAVLHEYAASSGHTIRIEQAALPVQFETVMATDMLGINAIHAANEGCVCLFVDPSAEQEVLAALRSHRYGADAVTVGEVTEDAGAVVLMRDADGRDSVVEELQGSELPRLC
ncbi:hydrogenase expression/formation protein HypE [Streptacidiphilus sp. ASG 303]|uniref:hydrogenase expression/formation protein HypE n=1 Tax=Streptacidiphilus sp. ASG 303 TaxID=2896847 RepID=UPI001E2DD2F7|nr:hydrogenase expression/formation protein HypE [Streptacidiphilus sp. ASG 303]MCD0484242.1 hydrogenase expression/formation protein HypE [Streptacidiphilus sp. ASG 303]